ncbi:unnamed protein product [Cuscuta europaea]|uniref:Uncharacterized protein n=1 Tax=Cuscuta europaea TaxID=41803 RepID=A0A9P1ELT1_CUSEU|nr:unnamed protein product [Cuscuta europaea]
MESHETLLDEQDAGTPPPRLSEIEKNYEEERGKKDNELGDSDAELGESQDDMTILAATGVYKGRVPLMGSEGIRILQKSKGASSSSHSVYDDRVTRLKKQLQERDVEVRKRDEEARIRDEEARRTREVRRAGTPNSYFQRQLLPIHAHTAPRDYPTNSLHGRYGHCG